MQVPTVRRAAAPYTSPYLAGVGVGLVLLLSFVLMGRGLGASGAFSSVVTAAVETAAPQHAAANAFYARYTGEGTTNPLADWLAAATGRRDGFALIAGMLVGVLAFGEAFPVIDSFAESTARGAWTMPQALGLSYGTVSAS